MRSKSALPMLAPALLLLLTSCGASPGPKPIPVLAQAHRCPAYPLPPAPLLKPPARTDFLTTTR